MCRSCDQCGKTINEGFCIDNGTNYFCSRLCMEAWGIPYNQYLKDYAGGRGDSYYTTWEEHDEACYNEGRCEHEEVTPLCKGCGRYSTMAQNSIKGLCLSCTTSKGCKIIGYACVALHEGDHVH